MELTVERDVHAGTDRLWAVLADPVDWPRWTRSVREIRLLDGDLAPGSRAWIVQPGLRPMVWTVTELVPGRELTWTASAAGVVTTGRHSVRPGPGGTSRLRLGLEQRGVLAPVVQALFGRRSRRYVELEADGLRRAAEADHPG
ncbi:SRPBCC family protein [Pseudonocardia sp. C8]|uniref:SRPBCC family protein n=1 Tax=Pseudonocardia sp. C8 TaxID=2762759 RepID=UPI0016434780|nr:SRPBCC family protein [Pseudonocardia sp. C8]MBC3192739.1 SRPBCC family protein [Pseudonocardia sp. C8]